MSFPLADWVLGHPDVPHNLAISGMKGALATLPDVLRSAPPPDADALRDRLARLHGVKAHRVFVTHGATEANALVFLYLARNPPGRGHRPKLFTPLPEYPPLRDAAGEIGYLTTNDLERADVVALSSPRNPLGTPVPLEEVARCAEDGRAVLVDQTFREFTPAASVTRAGIDRLWVSGSFTKIYGADDLRIGYAIAPEESVEGFGQTHGLLLDRIPPPSISGALAILANRSQLLLEARKIFRMNARYLRESLDGVPNLAAPVWFDRGKRGLDGDALAHRLLRRGILVCPGSFFGDTRGVRITLTRPGFPADLDAYLAHRDER